MEEVWKDINDYEGFYQASNLGRVKSLVRVVSRSDGQIQTLKEKIKKITLNGKGYMIVCLSKNGVTRTYNVHKLVAIAFLNHEPNGMKLVINHIDNDKTNNKADNLELVTQRHNASVDQWRKGKTSKYTGVSLKGHYKDGSPRWRVEIRINNKKKHLGNFRNEEDAAQAYQTALKQIH